MKNNISFEEAMALLEDSVLKLENGSLSLDESLKVFEESVKLIKFCNEKLSKAEQKVKILIESADGTVTDSDFSPNET